MLQQVVFMFSGQGSHYFQMGKELYVKDAGFRDWMGRLDVIARNLGSISITDILYGSQTSKSSEFSRTLYTHPSLFAVQYSLAQVFLERGIEPDFVLGSSMGEFVSAAISGVMGYEQALACVIKQAQILEENCVDGGMLAILGDPNLYYEKPELYRYSEIAGVNYDKHFVVSGDSVALTEIEYYLKSEAILCQRLQVSQAFHSSRIDPAEDGYLAFLEKQVFNHPIIPIISCLETGNLLQINRRHLWDVVRKPIQFKKVIENLERQGKTWLFVDLGPSGTLKGFAKANLAKGSTSECFSVLTPYGNDVNNLVKTMASVRAIERQTIQ